MTANRPKLGVSTLVRDGTRVLLVRRGKAPFRDTWSLPGGHVEHGERLAEAAAREVREETGIDVTAIRQIDVAEVIAGETHYVLIVFAARGRGQAQAGSDAAAAGWFLPTEIDALPMNADTRALIHRHLAEAVHA
ncbi:MAG TPA: NUDIX domain-containing protein [Bauldia sp.]|nr:NUDIX domain-containing protein [Bauldia sp.]